MTSEATSSPFRRGPFLVGLALITGATLSLEVLDTRLLSVITWYSLAFLVIAMGLFGLTAGALRVYFEPQEFEEAQLPDALAKYAALFALAVPVSLVLLLSVPLATAPVATTLPLFVLFGLALALPFYPAGVVIAAALTRTSLKVGVVYAVDLFGAALGAPLVPLMLRWAGGETSVLLVSVIAGLGALAFAHAGAGGWVRQARWVLASVVALAAVNGLSRNGLKPIWVKERLDVQNYEVEMWNSHSRVRVWPEIKVPAILWGGGAKCRPPVVALRVIEIDAGAGTAMYSAPDGIDRLDFLGCDVTDVANLVRPHGPAAIIGVGGSRDLQAALHAGHRPVFGIELNQRILDLLASPIGRATGVSGNPDVRLIHEEGRSWLTRSKGKFDLIQASLIDTWAATGAGAHALGENSLYTVDAWRTFLDRLNPTGIFTVSRWGQENLRVASLAMATLLSRSAVEPRAHIALVASQNVTTALISPSPLSDDDVARVHAIAKEKGFLVLAAPHTGALDPLLERILSARTRAELDAMTWSPQADFRAPTDNRPYFFNVLPIEAAWRPLPPAANMGSIEGNLLATRTLVLSLLASLVLVSVAIVVPLLRRARPRGHVDGKLWAGIAYFTLIGMGYMLAEVTLLQRLGLVLGDPSYSLIVVIASLVASTGLGSLISDRLPLTRAPLCYVFPLVIVAAITAISLSWPSIAAMILPAPISVRIVASVAITSALGALFGLGFPTGLRFAQMTHPEEAPWFWGMNGVGSILASSLAIILAQRWGLTVAMLSAAGCYLALLVPIAIWARA